MVQAASGFLRVLHPEDARPPELDASGASDGAHPDAAAGALRWAMSADECVEKSADRVRAVPELDVEALPGAERAPCTLGGDRSAA